MTTNNPPIAAWAPSTALHKLEARHNNAPCILTDTPAEFNDVALVRLADYEALQAECDSLRKAAEVSAADANAAEQELDAVRAECAQLRAAIRRLCNIYVIDDYYMGQLRAERLDAAVKQAIERVQEIES